MSERIDLQLETLENGDALVKVKVLDEKYLGHHASFSLVAEVEVKDRRGIDQEKILFKKAFLLSNREYQFEIPAASLKVYSYKGGMIEIKLHTRLKIDDGFLFDTKISEQQQLSLGIKPQVSNNAKAMVDPKDRFNFFANLKAIPSRNRVYTLALSIVGIGLIALNALLGVVDQFSAPGSTLFYDHSNADGEYESPLLKALMSCGLLGAVLWFLIKKQLQKYMQFHFGKVPASIRRGHSLEMARLVKGKPRVALKDVTLRVVACNMEKGQYKRGSGTSERTVSFEEPVRAVLLYEKTQPLVPAHTPLSLYFNESLSFDPMFEVLYPPLELSSSHGMGVHWEVQLLHPKFVDHELIGVARFHYEDFLQG